MSALALILALAAQEVRPPSAREQKDLVAEFFSLDPRSADNRTVRLRILEALHQVAPLTAREAASWRKRILKQAAAGRKLEKKAGEHWFWEEPNQRGRYFVGGETRRPEALLIAMHGGGEGSGDASSAHGAWNGAAGERGWVSISPEVLEKTCRGWTDSGTEEFVMDLVLAARRTWNIPSDRVYLAGHSMGGYGTWTIGAHQADAMAGLAASAGAPTPTMDRSGRVIGIDDGVVPNLRNVDMVVYQSDDDPRVGPEANRAAAAEVAKARERWGGFPFEYWEVTGRGHGYPEGGTGALLDRIKGARRNAIPERIVWEPALDWKHHFYWLWWDEPAIRDVVVADLDRGENAVSILTAADTTGLYVLLDDRVLDLEKEVVVRVNGLRVWRGVPERRLSALVLSAQRMDPGLLFEARIPAFQAP